MLLLWRRNNWDIKEIAIKFFIRFVQEQIILALLSTLICVYLYLSKGFLGESSETLERAISEQLIFPLSTSATYIAETADFWFPMSTLSFVLLTVICFTLFPKTQSGIPVHAGALPANCTSAGEWEGPVHELHCEALQTRSAATWTGPGWAGPHWDQAFLWTLSLRQALSPETWHSTHPGF